MDFFLIGKIIFLPEFIFVSWPKIRESRKTFFLHGRFWMEFFPSTMELTRMSTNWDRGAVRKGGGRAHVPPNIFRIIKS